MKHMKLFPKTFLHCVSLMIGVISIAFLLIYMLLPAFYRHYKQHEIDSAAKLLTKELQRLPLEESSSVIVPFATQKNFGYTATDRNGEIISSMGSGMSVHLFGSMEGSGEDSTTIRKDIDYLQSETSFYTADNQYVCLNLNVSLQPIEDAVSVLILLLPIVLLICVLLSVSVSWIYAKGVVKPIQKITDTTVSMRTLSPDIKCQIDRGDEIGALSQNVNELYHRLLDTIITLEKKMDEVKKAEQEKLDFLLLASHELKTPVTAVRGMIDGMLYNIGIYKDRDTYLKECQAVLENLTNLICSILETSKLDAAAAAQNKTAIPAGDLLRKVMADYSAIAQSRNLNISLQTEPDFQVIVSAELIQKVLSNVLSNAVKYTDEGKNIRIYLRGKSVIIENECIPLSQNELSHIGEPFYHPDGQDSHADSTGLGLYFTDRILSACNLQYSFLPYENGMRFTLNF